MNRDQMATGRRSAKVGWLIVWLGLSGAALQAQAPTVERLRDPMGRLLQAAGKAAGWTPQGTPRFFLGEEIYHYMDGAGEIPRACGFRLLAVADYRHRSGVSATVELYDMGDSAGAFGLYSMKRELNHRPVEATAHPASLSGGQLVLWKDRYTAILFTDDPRRLPEQALLDLGRALDRALPSAGKLPDLLRYLPRAGYLDRSAKYFHGKFALDTVWFHAENLFRLDAGTQVVFARYRQPDAKLLLVRYQTPQIVPRVLAVAHKALGAGQTLVLPPGFTGFLGLQQGRGIGMLAWRQWVGVVWEAPDTAAAGKRLKELAHSLQSPARDAVE